MGGTRRGVLFGLSSMIGSTERGTPEFDARLESSLVAALVYRGWWLTGASLAQHHPGFAPLPHDVTPPRLVA